MTAEILVDTDVLVYAYDFSAKTKQRRAMETLDTLAHTGTGVLSTQVLGEFFRVATQKLSPPLSKEEAYESIANLVRSWKVLDVTGLIVLEATRAAAEHNLAFWDAQIWATCKLNQVPVIFTEEVSTPYLEGIRYVNPFDPKFSLREWVS